MTILLSFTTCCLNLKAIFLGRNTHNSSCLSLKWWQGSLILKRFLEKSDVMEGETTKVILENNYVILTLNYKSDIKLICMY